MTLAAIILTAALAISRERSRIHESLIRLSWPTLLVAVAFGVANIFVSMLTWRRLLADADVQTSLRVAMRVFFIGQLGKYLPGSVWNLAAQAHLGRDYRLPRREVVTASLVSMAVSLAAATTWACLALPFQSLSALEHYVWVIAILPVLAVALRPKNIDRLTLILMRVLRREGSPPSFSRRGILAAFSWQLAGWVLIGAQVFALSIALGAPVWRTLPLALGGTALAWSAGFLAVPVPSGAVVREAVTVFVLSPVLSTADAISVALVSRVIVTAADFVWAGVAACLKKVNTQTEFDESYVPAAAD